MPLVDWHHILSDVDVLYSHLRTPHDAMELDQDVASLKLKNKLLVDIEWIDKRKEYAVTFSRKYFENIISSARLQDVDEVVALVVAFSKHH